MSLIAPPLCPREGKSKDESQPRLILSASAPEGNGQRNPVPRGSGAADSSTLGFDIVRSADKYDQRSHVHPEEQADCGGEPSVYGVVRHVAHVPAEGNINHPPEQSCNEHSG